MTVGCFFFFPPCSDREKAGFFYLNAQAHARSGRGVASGPVRKQKGELQTMAATVSANSDLFSTDDPVKLFELTEEIATGSYGAVYKVRYAQSWVMT